jgi:hypothetical protein
LPPFLLGVVLPRQKLKVPPRRNSIINVLMILCLECEKNSNNANLSYHNQVMC